MNDDEFDLHGDYPEDHAPRRLPPKVRELQRIKERFSRYVSSFSASGFEEDELVERVNDALDELIALAKIPSGQK